jgi:hypothetical protein
MSSCSLFYFVKFNLTSLLPGRMVENSPFDLEGGSGSRLEELDLGLEEVELGGEEAALLAVRTATLALVVAGGLALVVLTCRNVTSLSVYKDVRTAILLITRLKLPCGNGGKLKCKEKRKVTVLSRRKRSSGKEPPACLRSWFQVVCLPVFRVVKMETSSHCVHCCPFPCAGKCIPVHS